MSLPVQSLPERDAMCLVYRGPRAGSGRAIAQMMGWVDHYFKGRMSEVVVEHQGLPSPDPAVRRDPQQPVALELSFVIDDTVPRQGQFPPGFAIRRLPAERIVTRVFNGPLVTLDEQTLPWLAEVQREYDVEPLFRQRFLRAVLSDPRSPDWQIEGQLVLK